MNTDAISPEQLLKNEIREVYAKTYPNCIFSLTNNIERLKEELTALEAENAALRDALISIGQSASYGNLYHVDAPDVCATIAGKAQDALKDNDV